MRPVQLVSVIGLAVCLIVANARFNLPHVIGSKLPKEYFNLHACWFYLCDRRIIK